MPTIGDTRVNPDGSGEPQIFRAPGSWDTDWEKIEGTVTLDAPAHGLNAATLAGQGFTRGKFDGGTVRLAATTEDHDAILLGVVDDDTLSVALPNHAYQFPAIAPVLDTLGTQTLLYRSDTTDGAWTQSPATGDPIARYLGNGWLQMLEGATDSNPQMLPLGVGVVVPHFATAVPDDGWLPVSGGTLNDVDYPELAAAIAAGNTVGADLGDGTFRLLNLNGALTDGRGRVLEGLGQQVPGELQNDATAPNGLRVNRTYVQSDWNGQQNTDVSKGSNSNPGRANDGQVLSSSDTQTRAPAVSVLWMVRAKPWTHLGDVTINQAGSNIYANVADQTIPDTNIHTYAVDLPDLEVGDKITVVIARGTRLFECTSRFLFFGQVYESVFTPGQSAWTVEVVGSQLRIQSFGDGAQAVKAIFVER